jgi:alpha-N-acetylglucosaminidase
VFNAKAFAAPTDAARGVLNRLIGQRASSFSFESVPAEDGKDVYEVEASNGKVIVRGNSGVSMSRGAYDYLRQTCNVQVGWNGRHVDLPAKFPDLAKQRVVSPYQLRQDYNVCTFGYTTAFWGWDEWERELDWMALHGINMPLASVATEVIWQRVWLNMGITQQELDQYFTGPAFYPWHRMGNINGHDGPAPNAFFDKQLALQKKIIARIRELGMEPIAPAFAGFVPPAIQRVRPDAQIQHLAAWAQFDPPYRTHLLDPTSSLYPEIGKAYIQEWEREFGPAKYFLADSFNELQVPVPPDRAGRLSMLAKYGDAVYESIIAGEPNAVWVMQGWLFYNARKFWDTESVAGLLSAVPDDRMIILDLACDFQPQWSKYDAFYGKQWIYSVIHNMGGKSAVGGDLTFFASDAAKTLAAPYHGKLIGSGIAAEGVENNDVVYELITDGMWADKPIDLDKWLPAYCTARYGACPEAMKQSWDLLCKTCYGKAAQHTRAGYQYRPVDDPKWKNTPDDSPDFAKALNLFLDCSDALGKNALYRADAIELTAQYLGSRIDQTLKTALDAHRAGKTEVRDRFAQSALDQMDDLDALLYAHPLNRLDRWVNFARGWGDNREESDYFESDAKRQITTWGGPALSEYASKVWGGLVRGYYRGRWEAYFKSLAGGEKLDIKQWEEMWITTPGHLPPVRKVSDPLAECKRLVAKGQASGG